MFFESETRAKAATTTTTTAVLREGFGALGVGSSGAAAAWWLRARDGVTTVDDRHPAL